MPRHILPLLTIAVTLSFAATPAHATSTAIVPGKSIGGISIGMSRAHVLKRLGKTARPGNKKHGLRRAQIILQGKLRLEIGFGICGAYLSPAKRKICRKQIPDADPNRVGVVQTFSPDFTWNGVGVDSSAADVTAALGDPTGDNLCHRETGFTDESQAPWDFCLTRGGKDDIRTLWEFSGELDKEKVQVVSIYDPTIVPIQDKTGE